MVASSDQTIATQATELAKAGQFDAALKLIEAAEIDQQDADVECIYVKAVCLRKLGKDDDAITSLEQVLNLDEGYVRAFQELGHILLSQGKLSAAANAYEEAVAKDPALIASWRSLTQIYKQIEQPKALEIAQRELHQLEQLPPALQAVKSNLNRGNLDMADLICRQYLQSNKQDIEGMRLLAEIAIRAKVLDDAEFILESAVEFDSSHIGARFDYANVLIKRQKFGKAHEIAQQLLAMRPSTTQFKALLASTATGIGETEHGIQLYQELIVDGVNLEQCLLLLGHAQKTVGDIDASVQSYQKLYALKPDFGDAFWSLANLKTYQFSDQELAHMLEYRDKDETSDTDKVHFNFALGKAYEDRKQYDQAFAAYELGNALNKDLLKYSAPEIQERVRRQINICTPELFERLDRVGHAATDPIFIVGLPRAGSTLLEQILASHSKVDGTLELPNILSLARRLQGRNQPKEGEEPQYPRILGELDRDYFKRFGEQFINDTQVFRRGAPLFIDKMPNNFLHLGLIKLILPNAKIIDARRHPMACCFSGFKQLFAEGQEFTYGLHEVGNYYRNYVELMDHWEKVLPGFILRVQHEDVVDDLETQVRRILDFCDLEFEQSCIEFYKTERNVRTPSAEQVRQPIYKTGLEQWRHFEKHLNPLLDALGDEVLERYPIT